MLLDAAAAALFATPLYCHMPLDYSLYFLIFAMPLLMPMPADFALIFRCRFLRCCCFLLRHFFRCFAAAATPLISAVRARFTPYAD